MGEVAILPVSSESENGIVNENTHPQSDFNEDDVACGNAAETSSNATVVYKRHKKKLISLHCGTGANSSQLLPLTIPSYGRQPWEFDEVLVRAIDENNLDLYEHRFTSYLSLLCLIIV